MKGLTGVRTPASVAYMNTAAATKTGTRHLVPTPEAFAEQIREQHGPEARLHPANRLTACGRRMGTLPTTTNPASATCKTCSTRGRAGGGPTGRPDAE